MKILGIGLPKTGTKTLGECCSTWGLRHQSWELDCFQLLLQGNVDQILDVAEGFESFDDCPWYLLYREIDKRFPGSKFILTRRTNEDVWFDSFCKWADRFGPDLALKIREHVFGFPNPQGHKDAYVETYLAHNEAARAYFADRPEQMIEVCWEEDDGWDRLASFLEREVPDIPFPHVNKSSKNEIDI